MLCDVRMDLCYTFMKMEVVTFIGLKAELVECCGCSLSCLPAPVTHCCVLMCHFGLFID